MQRRNEFNHSRVENKWQKEWQRRKLFCPSLSGAKNPFYNLWMFPYPSAEGLHAGHAFASTGGDIYGRFMRMSGKDVFQPIGYDSFGIHSENFAIKIGEHPEKMLARTTKNYARQLKSLGHGYDWEHVVTTSSKDYYVWTQWLFVELFKAGLAFRRKSKVNWCPSCNTVLADEQVINSACERCQTRVVRKDLEQWFFRITDYADRLLKNLEKIDWPEPIKLAQRNWIGRSEGVKLRFELKEASGKFIEVFTTRPDTLNAATFLVLSPDSDYVPLVTRESLQKEVTEYIDKYQSNTEENHSREKTGIFSGSYAVNPETKEEIPVWISDYVVGTYGMGAIMGVPAHDERDKEFAVKLGIKTIEKKPDRQLWQKLLKEGWGEKYTNYHLRDWLISRQRYWGPPIPMIYCSSCGQSGKSWFSKHKPTLYKDQSDWESAGWYPEEKLPVVLPHIEDYQPQGEGKGPLAKYPEFYEAKCPNCGKRAVRETDVSDTFLDSSWYFLRYPSIDSKSAGKSAFDTILTKKWLPVDLYFGGAEHSVLHLMYARFMTMVLSDLGFVSFDEPFPRFFAHGLMIKDGAKMSKSRGNVVNPDSYIEKFGADAFRLYLMFIGPMDGSPDFRDTGMHGMRRFVDRLWKLFFEYNDVVLEDDWDSREVLRKLHQTIKKVTSDIQNFRYNVAIASIMEFVNLLEEKAHGSEKRASKIRCAEWDEAVRSLVLLLAPFAPHLSEEVWVEILGQKGSVHNEPWPKFNPEIVKEEEVEVVVQVNARLRATLTMEAKEAKNKAKVQENAFMDERIAVWIKDKKVKKTVFVPGKLINLVTD